MTILPHYVFCKEEAQSNLSPSSHVLPAAVVSMSQLSPQLCNLREGDAALSALLPPALQNLGDKELTPQRTLYIG